MQPKPNTLVKKGTDKSKSHRQVQKSASLPYRHPHPTITVHFKHPSGHSPFLFMRKKCNAIGQDKTAMSATAATWRKGAVT